MTRPASATPLDARAATATPAPSPVTGIPIVVHCHLRWSFVWQRPQQTHSRLAQQHPILFVEEPVFIPNGERGWLAVSEPYPNVLVAQPTLPSRPDETREELDARVRAVLHEALDGRLGRLFRGAVHWLYTPMMETQVDAFSDVKAIVYDCMDELSKFAFAPPELIARERRLLARADVVFTGGYELFLSKSQHHTNTHFFGCGVDFDHFHRAAQGAEVPFDLAKLPSPRLGYVGVIDERLDYEMLAKLAADLPDATIAMVGPVVKVSPDALPKAPNIHWLGGKDYAALPSYVAGFDVCLMPFALNEASRFINPTKTLEYLATGKPVLSTPVRDVVRNFPDVVTIAEPAEFSEAARRILDGERASREKGLDTARRSSWTRVVSSMEALVEDALHARAPKPKRQRRAAASSAAPREARA